MPVWAFLGGEARSESVNTHPRPIFPPISYRCGNASFRREGLYTVEYLVSIYSPNAAFRAQIEVHSFQSGLRHGKTLESRSFDMVLNGFPHSDEHFILCPSGSDTAREIKSVCGESRGRFFDNGKEIHVSHLHARLIHDAFPRFAIYLVRCMHHNRTKSGF